MKRIAVLAFALALSVVAGGRAHAAEPARALPHGPLNVAFVITANANVIDFAGPWEVFQDVSVPELGSTPDAQRPFHLFTVSDSTAPVTMTAGLRVVPDYTFANAPAPAIVVVGAQRGAPGMVDWLKRTSAHATVMSVCTGVRWVAEAGLLDGKTATTHHDFYDRLQSMYPKVKMERGVRWVESTPTLLTAGGLTSGIDLALHVVASLYGDEAARRTAAYMEHSGEGWRDASQTPVATAARKNQR